MLRSVGRVDAGDERRLALPECWGGAHRLWRACACVCVRRPPLAMVHCCRACIGCVAEFLTRESEQVEKAKAQIAVEVYTAMTEALNAK